MNVKDIFETMEYGPAPESAKEALAWIEARGGIAGPWIGGQWGPLRADMESRNPATGARLAGLTKCTAAEVDAAVNGRPQGAARLVEARRPWPRPHPLRDRAGDAEALAPARR